MKELVRKQYIDITKGVLILLVCFGHLTLVANTNNFCSEIGYYIQSVSIAFQPFYMAAFFFITGFCSSFNVSIGDFLLRNFKALIIPCCTFNLFFCLKHFSIENLLLLADNWFVDTLLCCKVLCWLSLKIKHQRVLWLLMFSSYLVGCVVGAFYNVDFEGPYLYPAKTLIFLPFLYLGVLAKEKGVDFKGKGVLLSFAIYVMAWLFSFFFLSGVPTYYGNLKVNYDGVFPNIVLSLAGICMILQLCKWMETSGLEPMNRFISWCGRSSLIIYLTHLGFYARISARVVPYIDSDLGRVLFLVALFAVTVAIGLLISFILSKPKLCWLIGKW